jgi:hypothetical protein
VRLSDPGEIAAALPHLVGFRPAESVVLVSLTGPTGGRVGLTVRADLPPPPFAGELARQITDRVAVHDPDGVLIAVVSEAPDLPDDDERPFGGPDLPHRHLVHELVLALDRAGILVRDALLVRAGRWWSYECPDPCCAPGAGTAVPEGTSELAAAAVLAGAVVAGSRAELEERLAPSDEADRALVAAACLDSAAARAARAAVVGWPAVGNEAWGVLREAVARRRPGGLAALIRLSAAELAEVVWGLRDPIVRDRALGLCLGEDAEAAEAVWTECARRAPAPLDAAPATLVAVAAWLRGEGAMANVALDRALGSDPGYRLAGLLGQGLAACVPPTDLREMIAATTEDLDGLR